MDSTASAAPNETFSLPSDRNLYGTWDSNINPKAYFERRFNKTCQSVDDNRPYSAKVIEYLEKAGAQLVESSLTIADKVTADEDSALLTSTGLERLFIDPGVRRRLYWYKNNLVELSSADDGTQNIEVTWAIDGVGVHEEFKPFLAQRKEAGVGVLLQGSYGGLTIRQVDFDPPVIADMDLNYGTGFKDKVHTPVLDKLKERKSGLVLFHGAPGTGKSTYIKYLTSLIKRQFIFVPVSMAGDLSSPSFLKLLMGYPDSVVVLEDAEQALQSRERDFWNSSVVSTLLNLSDGLLGTMLNISIIATYNADKQTVDPALLRKGRLRFDYSFDKLSVDDANRLAASLGKHALFTEPTSLADIYNVEDDTNYAPPVTKTMGFGFGG